MKPVKLLIGGGIVVVILVLWAVFRPEQLFVHTTVNDAMPTPVAASSSPSQVVSGVTPSASASAAAALIALKTGDFKSLEHSTSGKAMIYDVGNGSKVLRLSDFSTSSGPDVHVYLVASANGSDDATIKAGNYLDLGSIKGSEGNQNYDLPASVDLTKYQSVSIWCKRFLVNFGAANLQ